MLHNDHHHHQFLREDSIALPSGTKIGTGAVTGGFMIRIVGCFLFRVDVMTEMEDTAICPLLELSTTDIFGLCSWSGCRDPPSIFPSGGNPTASEQTI